MNLVFMSLQISLLIMSYPNVYNYGSFMRDVELKVDGSNFID